MTTTTQATSLDRYRASLRRVEVLDADAERELARFVVVDQLPQDLLERFDPAFQGGFRRLRDGGLRFLNLTHDHATTETAPGHATLVSGTHPARHGPFPCRRRAQALPGSG